MKNKKKLLLVTDGFPFRQSSEAAFITPELSELVKVYDVSIVSCCTVAEGVDPSFERGFSETVAAYHYEPPKGRYLAQLFVMLRAISDPVFVRELFAIIKAGSGAARKTFWTFLNYYWALDFGKWVKNQNVIKENEEFICYTYWNQYYLFGMARHKKQYPYMKLVSRIHGYDLFRDRSPMGWQPFKQYMDRMTDRTVFISEQGKAYYEGEYHAEGNAQKHVVCRLGVLPQDVSIKMWQEEFLLVSCSNLCPFKRIDLIIEALALIRDCNIRWVHFGKGEEEDKLTRLAEEKLLTIPGISYEFKGFLPNEEILHFYRENNPACFITTSETEGSPVSMQEAIACGIPVIGTDVGGIYEMIDGNGVLLPENPSVQEIAEAICKIYHAVEEEYMEMSRRSFGIWDENFNRERNNRFFLHVLETL